MAFDLLDQVESNLTSSEVGIVEFCESEAYCNKPLYPRQRVLLKIIFLEELTPEEDKVLDYWIAGGRNGTEVRISPNIRERMAWLKERGYKHFREIDLVGGRRASKGFVTGQAMGKILWDTLQLQDPGRYYGIDPDKNIYFSCVAGSESQAREFQFADLSGCIESCAAFTQQSQTKFMETEFRVSTSEDMRRMAAARRRGTKSERDMARLRGKALAANAGTLRGSATMAICIDEMAHMIPGESKASAEQVYNAAMPSLDQFGRDAIAFCNSSPYSKVGMFYERNQIALRPFDPNFNPGEEMGKDRRPNGDPRVFTFEFPSWALFEDGEKLGMHMLTVSPDWDIDELNEDGSPRWDDQTINAILSMRSEEAANPETFKVERRGKFAEVTDAYLNPANVDKIFAGKPDGWDLDGNLLLMPFRTNSGREAIPGLFKYKFHCDPSSTTAGFGFAIGHTEYVAEPSGENKTPHVIFDLIKRWNPKEFPGNTIQWPYVINEILEYAAIFRPYEITFDQFQSAEPIQTLKYALMERGIDCNVYVKTATLEHNWFRAETSKTAINHGLVHAPNDSEDLALASDELKFLQIKQTGGRYPRVDKQDAGPVQTKDMADCIFEVIESEIGNQLKNLMRDRAVASVMAPGAQGGFRIGGDQQGDISQLHPNLPAYYGKRRAGGQMDVGYSTIPGRASVGGGRRGMNRGASPSRRYGR